MGKAVVICIVDDDDVYQYTITRALKSDRLVKKILVFSDGEEALDFVTDNIGKNENLPDVIFLDVNMPIMDGWQFLEEYVKIKPRVGKQITIYMVTSSVDPVDVEKAEKFQEISDYLVKPIQPDQLRELVATLENRD